MTRKLSRLVGVLAVLVGILAAGGLAQAQSSPSLAKTVTWQDNGKTLHLNVGDSFLLDLGGPPPVWQVTVSDSEVVSREVNVLVVRGAQGIYRAVGPGAAVLTAVGTYPCAASHPRCALPDRVFHLGVVVAGAAPSVLLAGRVTGVAGDTVTLVTPPVRPSCPPGTFCPEYILAGRTVAVDLQGAVFFDPDGIPTLAPRLAAGALLVVHGRLSAPNRSSGWTLQADACLVLSGSASPAAQH